ncbi:MAG TPA: type I DNA topoisomerase [Ruminococcaceae bacterium]|nr:type I DNA topoisomerase [Oscillospiraceae bacterium]
MSKLVIVESPAKAHTIQKYLGPDYEVMASMGHVRDLPASRLSVDVKNDFAPNYENIKGKGELIKKLCSEAKKSDYVYLATDPDREGEAISWHLAQLLKLDEKEPNRVTFNEITKSGIQYGMAHPRCIDQQLVDAQQARRVLDRIVGYEISPFLWKKIRKGLSAGRVQSVAVRLVVDREEEIRAFQPEEYWSLEALLAKQGAKAKPFTAKYYGTGGKKCEITTEEQANALKEAAEKEPFIIKSIKMGTRQKNPAPPFITSTLQQDASRRFGFQAKRTMKVAQELYEGINLPDLGAVGLITYMRTDSLRISDEALSAAHDYIKSTYGDSYALPKPRTFRSKSNAQDGHEAIRPTMIDLAPAKIKESLTSDQYKLYKLVWERFIASQMAACVQDTVSTDITAGEHLFKASGFSVRFDGYTRLYTEAVDNEEEQGTNLPRLEEGETLTLKELKPNQHFTQPPPRYTEATLIRELEENGIGRPSTYAPTLSTILQRGYVEREGKAIKPTIVGETVTKLMKEQFGKIVDVKFTAEMEQELDEVEEGKTEWVGMMHHFYDDFTDMLQSAEKNMEGTKMKIPDEETDIVCELCGRKMVVRHGKYGKFLACPGFPECKNTKTLQQETPGSCPRCGKKVLAKKSKTGRTYYGCEDNPKCGFMTWDIPLAEKCPQCGSSLFKTTGRVKMIHCLKEGCGYEKSAK